MPNEEMKKFCLDLDVVAVERLNARYVLIRLTHTQPLPPMKPGQFVEVRVDHSPQTFLRRPISINYVDIQRNEMGLLVATVGHGTRQMALLKAGDTLNCVFPLGNPMLFRGQPIQEMGAQPTFLLGARTAADLLEMDLFERTGRVLVTTEDGSAGEKGFVTNHSVLQNETFDMISTCGPKPMMMAVARYAREKGTACEVSLENLMACGIGACLCCVEKTVDGNLCACKEGPVFNIQKLLW